MNNTLEWKHKVNKICRNMLAGFTVRIDLIQSQTDIFNYFIKIVHFGLFGCCDSPNTYLTQIPSKHS